MPSAAAWMRWWYGCTALGPACASRLTTVALCVSGAGVGEGLGREIHVLC